MARISLRLSEGEADLGGTTIPLQRDPQGLLQLGGGEGPKLRALRFGERGRIVRQALTARDDVAEVVSGVTAAATIDPGKSAVDPEAVSVLALHLAGAGSGGPGFSEAMALLARSLGWSPEQLADAEASEVDELASHLSDALLAAQEESSQWQSIVFREGSGGSDAAAALGDLQRELARDLLERGQSLPDPAALGAPAAPLETPESAPAQRGRDEQSEQAPQQQPLEGPSGTDSISSEAAPSKSKDPQQQTGPDFDTPSTQSSEAPQGKDPSRARAQALDAEDSRSGEDGQDGSATPSKGSSESRASDAPQRRAEESRPTPRDALEDLESKPPPDRFIAPRPGGGAPAPGDFAPARIGSEADSDLQELLRDFDDAHQARQRVSGKAPAAAGSSASKALRAQAPADLAPEPGPALEADDLEELADFIANELHRAADQRRVDP